MRQDPPPPSLQEQGGARNICRSTCHKGSQWRIPTTRPHGSIKHGSARGASPKRRRRRGDDAEQHITCDVGSIAEGQIPGNHSRGEPQQRTASQSQGGFHVCFLAEYRSWFRYFGLYTSFQMLQKRVRRKSVRGRKSVAGPRRAGPREADGVSEASGQRGGQTPRRQHDASADASGCNRKAVASYRPRHEEHQRCADCQVQRRT